MEELYLIEIFINKVNLKEDSSGRRGDSKRLSINVDFGKIASFVIKQNEFEGEILHSENAIVEDISQTPILSESETISTKSQETIETLQNKSSIENNTESEISSIPDAKISKSSSEWLNKRSENFSGVSTSEYIFNSGASVLFSSPADGLIQNFDCHPVELSMWSNTETEKRATVGFARMLWDRDFYDLVNNAKTDKNTNPVVLKENVIFNSEYACSEIGQGTVLIKLSPFGKRIMTHFREMPNGNGRSEFLFRNDSAEAFFTCKHYGKNAHPVKAVTVCPAACMEYLAPKSCRSRLMDQLTAAGLSEDAVKRVVGEGDQESNDAELMKIFLIQKEIGSFIQDASSAAMCDEDCNNECACASCGRDSSTEKAITDEELDSTTTPSKDLAMQKYVYEGLVKMLAYKNSKFHKSHCQNYRQHCCQVQEVNHGEKLRRKCTRGTCKMLND